MKLPLFFTLLLTFALAVSFTQNSRASDFPKGSPAFLTSYEAALKAGKQEGKPVIAIFSASWCPPCQTNKRNVYPSTEVKPFHDKFVWAYLDADEESNVPAMKKFEVSGIPHIQFLNAKGTSIGSLVGGTSAKDFGETLADVLKKAKASE